MTDNAMPDWWKLSHHIDWVFANGVWSATVANLGLVAISRKNTGGCNVTINGIQLKWYVSGNLDAAKSSMNSELRQWLYLDQYRGH